MSLFDYIESQSMASHDYDFYALIMAAFRKADSDNAIKLRAAFPDVFDELYARYNAIGGRLPDEVVHP